MPNSYVKIDVHMVFHIKSGTQPIAAADTARLFSYIGGIVRSEGGMPVEIGGTGTHVHALFSLPPTKSMSDFARVLKSKSSRWLKDLGYTHFSWQEGYGAFSVSPSTMPKVVNYIRNQEEHHRRHTFKEECMMFFDAYRIPYDEKYLSPATPSGGSAG
ncbi:MAG: transposase [Bacteroidales bacterium]|nr:transposase [Bacteroidales bacterium]